MCLGNIPDESCGWPKGTVRSALSLIIVNIGLLSLVTLMILLFTAEKYEAAIGVGGSIGGFVGIVIGYYFGSKSAEGAAKLISKVEGDLLDRNRELEAGLFRQLDYRQGIVPNSGKEEDDGLLSA